MKHVFVSYVSENAEEVKRLRNELQAVGIDIWLDRDQIMPGERWQDAIRRAIASGAFFIACFSEEYLKKNRTYMNEELVIAIDELRMRPAGRAWFIPIRLSDCLIPDRNIGGGETLRSIQYVDLYSDWDNGIRRLTKTIQAAVFPSFLRSPRLGIEFWQDDYKSPLLDAGAEVVRVVLQSKPFEIRIPRIPKRGNVMICSSYDASIFSQVADEVNIESVPFFRSATGMADTIFGSSHLFVNPKAHMHFDWGKRLYPLLDEGGVILINAIYKARIEEPRIPKGKDIFTVIHIGHRDTSVLKYDNFERFVLSF